ncbi:hypothetical protein ACFX19_035658 [Malus domestica]
MVSERLGPLPRPRPTANLGKEQQVPEEHEGTWDSSDKLALEVSTASPRKNHTPLLKLSHFQEAMETYERKFQYYKAPLMTSLSYSSLKK